MEENAMSTSAPQIPLVTTIAELRAAVEPWRRSGRRVGLVPTMGALHEGHISLVRAALAECSFTVVSIYVNPTQFAPHEDFARYPRTLQADLDALGAVCAEYSRRIGGQEEQPASAAVGEDNSGGVATVPQSPVPVLVFAPADAEMYRPQHATWVEVGGVAEPLEGVCRPGHFRGVATIVLKLFLASGADVAYFGQKDFQQARVIQQMVADLNVPIQIRLCPTVREPDGLAMSSRNRYLSSAARQRALVLWKSLELARKLVARGERNPARIIAEMEGLIRTAQDARIEYVALVDPHTLQPMGAVTGPTLAAVAVRIESTRLIDNLLLEPPG
jgi:pantoate--beta-alanine ligase